MNTPTIPDLVTFRELHGKWTSAGRAAIVDLINARHRVRMNEAINERDVARDDLKQVEESRVVNGRLYERALSERDAALAEIERLKLDIGIFNGRLIERTEALLAKQREYLDRARAAERRELRADSTLANLIPELRKMSEILVLISGRRIGTQADRKRWKTLGTRLANYATAIAAELEARGRAALAAAKAAGL